MDLLDGFGRSLAGLGVRHGDRLGLAVSGGADSTAMAALAARVGPRAGIELHVLHVDHGLRPGSHDDARHVVGLAGDLGLAWSVVAVGVTRPRRGSIEAAARDVRYRALGHLAGRLGLSAVATAHTLDDQAETVLLRLMRGTGIRGLGAIAPRRGPFVRPLLRVGRDELHAWLETSGLEHRTDPSNADLDRDRNWLRTVILPQLAQRRSGVAATLARLADHARDDEMYLDELAAAATKRIVVDDLGVVVPVDVLRGPPAIASRVAREALSRAHVRIEAASVDALLELALRDRGHLPLTGDVGAWRLVAAVALLSDPVEPPAAVALPDEGTIALPEYGVVLRVSDGRAEPWTWRCGVPDAPGLSVRSRRPGDRVPTRRGTRKVQDVLVDAKVPRPLRSRTAVLVGADGPAGVVGVTGPRADLGTVVDARPLSRIWDHTGAWSDTTVRATS